MKLFRIVHATSYNFYAVEESRLFDNRWQRVDNWIYASIKEAMDAVKFKHYPDNGLVWRE